MGLIFKIALRNLGRNRTRTVLTGAMIALGTALVVFSIGANEGTYVLMAELATRVSTGHMQVQHPGFLDKPTLHKTVKDPEAARAALTAHPEVEAVAVRVVAGGMFSAGTRTVGGALLGVEPEREGGVSSIPASVKTGAWLPAVIGDDDPLPVVLSGTLAKQLRAQPGAEVAFISQGADGSLAAELFEVTGLAGEDQGVTGVAVAFVRLQDAQALLVLPGRVHQVVAQARAMPSVGRIVSEVQVAGPDVLRGWESLVPTLARSIEKDRAGGYIFLLIILAVALLGVANTMLMSVLERTREFGVLMALGTTPRQIVGLTLAEGFWLSFLAVALGTGIGALANYWVGQVGIPLGDAAMEFGGVTIDRMIATNTLKSTVLMPALVLVSGVTAALLPALRAARLQPTAALRA